MRSGKISVFIFIILFLGSSAFGQESEDTYFFPVRPGERNYLAGTMGEIRATHFHTGIDIKTSGITGLKVYATHTGYVSRIRVGPAGYGNCLYIIDKNGETAVYGHLLRFRDDIQQYTVEEQYKRQSFEVNLFPAKDKFPVEIGDFIALSGNSGSTTGPHLHFELRDPHLKIINPLSRHFKEIKDDIPPIVQAFSIKTLDIHSRVNDQFGNFIFSPTRADNVFENDDPIDIYGTIGIEVQAFDRLNGAANRDGIPYIKVYLDGNIILDMDLTTFSIPQASNTPVYYDNRLKMTTRRTFQKLFIDDGNQLPFYKSEVNKGKITIRDTLMHQVQVVFTDLYGNQSFLNLHLRGAIPKVNHKKRVTIPDNPISWDSYDNTLVIKNREKGESPDKSIIYSNHRIYEMIPAYTFPGLAVFLWDLRQGLPDSVKIGNNSLDFDFKVTIPPDNEFSFFDPYYDLKTTKKSLYDTLYLTSSYRLINSGKQEVFTIGNENIPLDGSIHVKFIPRLKYDSISQYGVYNTENFRNYNFEGNDWSDNGFNIRITDLGNFTILRDSVPPEIDPVRISNTMVSFRIRDNLSGIKNYSATIDGKWLLMNYDPKKNLIWSERLDQNIPLNGEFNLEVTDNCGNKSNYSAKIE